MALVASVWCLAIHVDQDIKGVDVLNGINELHRHIPEWIQVDNGSEFIFKGDG